MRLRSTLTANTNDWNPSKTGSGWRVDLANNYDLTGIIAPTPGESALCYLMNISEKEIKLKNDDTGSTLGNRFLLPNAADFTVKDHQTAILWYDFPRAAWVVVGS